MIDLYYMPSPNTWKVSIMLEECALQYQVKMIDIMNSEQSTPEFLAISPNGRIPAIVDHDAAGGAQSVFESGAILVYLAEKTGRFLAPSGPARVEAMEWLFWQMSGLGPMAGQTHHFLRYAPKGNDYAADRYKKETARLYGVLDRRLAGRDWVAGGDYGIADMSMWGWAWFHPMHGQSLDDFPNVKRWFLAMSDRPAVQRGKVLALDRVPEEHRQMLDGPFYGHAADFMADKSRVK